MKMPRLLPQSVEECVNDLVNGVARRNSAIKSPAELKIIVKDVMHDGMPAGDYEVVVRRKPTPLAKRLKSLDNPWMQLFEK